jgi:hypothetical protein
MRSDNLMTLSVVLILPAAMKPAGNALATSLRWQAADGDTFSVSLSPDGKTVTHYGTHAAAQEDGEFTRLMADPPEAAKPVLAAMTVSVRTYGDDFGMPHFAEVIAGMGLAIWSDDAP